MNIPKSERQHRFVWALVRHLDTSASILNFGSSIYVSAVGESVTIRPRRPSIRTDTLPANMSQPTFRRPGPTRNSRRWCSCTRREFAGGVAALLIGRGSGLEPGCCAEDRAAAADGYVDMHTHLGQTWNTTEVLTAETLLRWMDAHRIGKAVVLPLVSPESSSYPLTSEFVLAQTQPFRDRLIPFCAIDPRVSHRGGQGGLTDMLRRYVDLGARGFGEHKPGIAVDDPRNLRLFAACQEVGLPVLFHLDSQRNTDRPGLPGLERVLRETPDCHFIGHGPGWWASVSGDASELGGYPKGKVIEGGAVDRLMELYSNIHGELSAESGANAIRRDIDFGRKFLIRRQDRILFGTDFLSPGQPVSQFDLFERQLDLPAEVAAKILRINAQQLLGLT